MYKYVSLNKTTAAFYENLAHPAFRSRLRALDYDKSIVALGIHLDSQPVGLVLAEYFTVQNQKIATILSL